MSALRNLLKTGALAAVLAAGAVGAMTTAASADVVCNRYGECWKTSQRYETYPTTLGVQFYTDDWRESHRHDRHYRWRHDRPDDRGYYRNGRWHRFDRDGHR